MFTVELYAKIRHAVMISTTPACPAELNEAERAVADEHYRSIQARSASATASGRSIVDR